MRRVVLLLVLISACSSERKRPVEHTSDAQPVDSVWVVPDAAPPTVDAPPAPMPACTMDAGECQLPPSACLDQWYLLYYTGGDCVGGTCQFTTNLMWCPDTCQNGGCLPGFT